MYSETLEQMQARHRKELKELQGRITSKKKNASKKTRKGVNDECAELERQMKEKHTDEITALHGGDADPESETETTKTQDDELSTQTDKLNMNDTTTPQKDMTEETTAQIQGGGGKKRNRQKERLARRAAEQEAAADKAQEEAAGMTDHRAMEDEYMKKVFKIEGLVEKEVEPDGHCLFSSVADQLSQNGIRLSEGGQAGKTAAYKIVRQEAASFMQKHRDDFAPFLEEDFDEYVVKMRDTAEWGGELELTALARRYGVGISVVQDGRTEKIGEGDKQLWLAYYRHGYGLGEHYNSLRRK